MYGCHKSCGTLELASRHTVWEPQAITT
uniref:Uncharacterized protein n=1 Tax=Lepeophtheirus salmonis TaxID=72036 RepID=A0A0K2THU3_LEPSM